MFTKEYLKIYENLGPDGWDFFRSQYHLLKPLKQLNETPPKTTSDAIIALGNLLSSMHLAGTCSLQPSAVEAALLLWNKYILPKKDAFGLLQNHNFNNQQNILHLAAKVDKFFIQHSNVSFVERILNTWPNNEGHKLVNTKDAFGEYPLMLAVESPKAVSALLKAGADAEFVCDVFRLSTPDNHTQEPKNLADYTLRSAFACACKYDPDQDDEDPILREASRLDNASRTESLNLLVKHEVPSVRTQPTDIFEQMRQPKMVNKSTLMDEALAVAAYQGNEGAFNALLAAGANRDVRVNCAESGMQKVGVLDVAAYYMQFQMVKFLVDNHAFQPSTEILLITRPRQPEIADFLESRMVSRPSSNPVIVETSLNSPVRSAETAIQYHLHSLETAMKRNDWNAVWNIVEHNPELLSETIVIHPSTLEYSYENPYQPLAVITRLYPDYDDLLDKSALAAIEGEKALSKQNNALITVGMFSALILLYKKYGGEWNLSSKMGQLIGYGVDPNPSLVAIKQYGYIETTASESPLTLAALAGCSSTVEQLIKEGASLQPEGGTPPLVAAVLGSEQDMIKTVRMLLEKGAKPNQPDRSGHTAQFHLAMAISRRHQREELRGHSNLDKYSDVLRTLQNKGGSFSDVDKVLMKATKNPPPPFLPEYGGKLPRNLYPGLSF